MADETYGPKPPPGDRMVSWPVLIWSRVWCYLSWPWQVREMKRYGFRRVGWMTWEAGPALPQPGTGQAAPARVLPPPVNVRLPDAPPSGKVRRHG